MVRAVAPKPLNVVVSRPGLSLAELTALGVRRVSVGGALARVAWGAVVAAAGKLRAGSFEGLAGALPGGQLDEESSRRELRPRRRGRSGAELAALRDALGLDDCGSCPASRRTTPGRRAG